MKTTARTTVDTGAYDSATGLQADGVDSDDDRARNGDAPVSAESGGGRSADHADPSIDPEPEPLPPGDEDMPPLDSIDAGGPVDAFFSPRVSESLRQAALQRLFRQPKLNVIDGLDDYCEDYRNFTALGNVVPAEMRYRIEQTARRLAQKMEDALNDEVASAATCEPDPASACSADRAASAEPPSKEVQQSGEPGSAPADRAPAITGIAENRATAAAAGKPVEPGPDDAGPDDTEDQQGDLS